LKHSSSIYKLLNTFDTVFDIVIKLAIIGFLMFSVFSAYDYALRYLSWPVPTPFVADFSVRVGITNSLPHNR
jgi:hypothetical protein